MFKINCSLD
jgi:hypothetical protein